MKRIGMALGKGNPSFQNRLRSLKESINIGVRALQLTKINFGFPKEFPKGYQETKQLQDKEESL